MWGGIKMQTQHFQKSTSTARKAGGQIAGIDSFLATRSMAAQVFCLLSGFKKDVFLLGLNKKEYSAFPNSPLPFICRGLRSAWVEGERLFLCSNFRKPLSVWKQLLITPGLGGKKIFAVGGRSWSESQKLLAPFHPAMPSLGNFEPVPVWALRFLHRWSPEKDQICWFFTALCSSAHKLPLHCSVIHSEFTLLGSNNPQTSEMPRISSRANVCSRWWVLLAPRPACIPCKNLTSYSSAGDMHCWTSPLFIAISSLAPSPNILQPDPNTIFFLSYPCVEAFQGSTWKHGC